MKTNTQSILSRAFRGVTLALLALCALATAPLASAQLAELTKLADFEYSTNGGNPYGSLVEGSDGAFYGLTYSGGANDVGTAFKVTAGGTLTKLADLDYSTTGGYPRGSLVEGSDGAFYGLTNYGGATGYGTAFKVTTAGVLTKLADFSSTTGGYPQGSLVEGSDGAFYGLTNQGGANGHGTAFKVTTAGVLTKLADFNSSTTGGYPQGSLVEGSDGAFYGLTNQGGANGHGTAFKVTTAGVLTKLADFNSSTTGRNPRGSLVEGSDGAFYGLTFTGGANGAGTAFKVTTAGVLTKLADFDYSTKGGYPKGSLVEGSDGAFYGLTNEGGATGYGTAFKVTTAGVLTKLADFSYTTGGYPSGDLVQGSDGAFYGLAPEGGSNYYGTVFTLDAGLYTYPGPRISVAGVDDGGSVSYGTIATGTNSDRVFTIKNKGNSPLTGLTVGVDGTNASSFTVIASPVTPINTPGGTTTFTVRFASATSGARTATLHIASNDLDRNPYDITLTGTALPQNWQPQVSNFTQTFQNVDFLNSTTGWAVGDSGNIRKTTDGGATWTTQTSGTGESLYGVSFADANTGWVSGTYGTLRKTTNGGASWSTQTSASGAHCWAVFALNSTTAWEAGSSGLLGRTTNGVNWSGSQDLPSGNPGFGMYDIQFADANNGWAAAGGSWSARTTNAGVSWTQMNTVTNEQLLRMDFISATTGWAVGNNGTIIKTTDGGTTWTVQTSGTTVGLTGVSFVDANTGWVVGANGTILHTTDGGTTWAPEFSNTTAYLTDVDFTDADHGWIVGQTGLILTYAPAPVVTNSAPTDIALSANSIAENNAPGATIGTLSATDPDSADTHTFTFAGGADDAAFTITGSTLSINGSADFETRSSYSIRIRATDSGAGNLTFEKNFMVSITDVTIPQTITFGPLEGKTFGDAAFNVSATGGASGQPVTFTASGPVSLSGNEVTITGAGSVTITAHQNGAGDYTAAADVDQTFTVAKATQTIDFVGPGFRVYPSEPLLLGATASSGGPITFSVVSGPATVSGNTVTFTGPGMVTIRASQAGDVNLEAAYVERTSQVWGLPTIVLNGSATLEVPSNSVYTDAGVTASSASDGPLVVTTKGTVNTAVLGTQRITYSAKDSLDFSVSATRTVNVVDHTDPTLTLTGGDHVTVAVGSGAWADPGYWAEDETTLKKNANPGTTQTIGGGQNYGAAIRTDGTLAVWGLNVSAVLDAPGGLSDVRTISTSNVAMMALQVNGETAAWGQNGWNDLSGSNGLTGIKAIASTYFVNLAVDTNGGVMAYGAWSDIERIPPGLTGVTAISSGQDYTVALKEDGTLVAWGQNYDGRTDVPPGLSGVIAIAAGNTHTLALKDDGTVVAWGTPNHGQLDVPVGLSGVIGIAVASDTSLALKSDGTVVAWGGNDSGLKDGAASQTGIVSIGAGYQTAYGVKADGSVVAWGKTDAGEADFPVGLVAKKGGTAPATEPINANLTAQVIVTGTVNTNIPGDYVVTYEVTDYSGNTTTKTRTVTVSAAGSGPQAVNDAVTVTAGTTRIYPLANDGDPNVAITSVSEPGVSIDGRALIIPAGFSGTFTYTTNRGRTASVTVTAGTPQSARTRWSGLLTDGTGAIVGRMSATRSTKGTFSASVRVGATAFVSTFSLRPEPNGTAIVPTTLGNLTVTENDAAGRLNVSLAHSGGPFTGSLRRSALTGTAQTHNVALASIDAAYPGGGIARVSVRSTGFVVLTVTMPDGKTLSAKSDLADNGTFSIYSPVSLTSPTAYVGGEFNFANLAATDVTGELAWIKPAQPAAGLHQSGVSTTLTANGCVFAPGVSALPAGAGTLTISGGNLASSNSSARTITAGKPTVNALVPAWTAFPLKGTFTAKIKTPANPRTVTGSGIYLPKSNSAWGFFPGTTLGGRILLTQP